MENEMNFCPGCGQPLQPGSSFCPKCGRKLDPNASSKQNGLSFSKIKDSVSELGKQAKGSKVGAAVSSAASDAFSKINEELNPKDGKKPNTPLILILLGSYLVFFFDLYLGLLLLIPSIIYLVLRKVKPEKAERLVTNIKDKLQPITSKPLLYHGLIALLIGIVVLRTLGVIPGCIIIGLSLVFLALTKFAPAFAEKIDNECAGISDKLKLGKIWQNNWVKVAVFALLLLVPILGVRPGQSVYSIAQSENTSNTFIQKGRNSKSSNQAHSNGIKTTTFSYQSDIMAYLRSHKFVASNGNYLTFSNSWITNEKAKRIGVTQYEILKWDSKTALVNAHTPYGTPPITIYVYAAEGHIIIDGTMYFAK